MQAVPSLLSRRTFFRLSLGARLFPPRAERRIRTALQLFSVRDQCQRNLPGALDAIRAFGYEGVEFAGFYGRQAAEIRAWLDASSLEPCGSHTPLTELEGGRFADTVAFNREIGNRNLIVPGLAPQYHSREGWIRAAGTFNELVERLRPFGMRIGYHNHAIEFQPIQNELPFDLFFSRAEPSVIMEVDLGNARLGGADPIAVLRRYPGRAVSLHVKDCLPGRPDVMLGESNFAWPTLFRVCETVAGTEWYIIEHESKDRPSLEAARENFARFRQLREELWGV